MALYGYECRACGHFEAWRPIDQALEDIPCPACGTPSPRQISTPFLAAVSREVRTAHERNERAAERPRVVGHDELHKLGPRLGHGHSHGRSMYSSVLGHAH
jgi:putative FmdB family regulatory protein